MGAMKNEAVLNDAASLDALLADLNLTAEPAEEIVEDTAPTITDEAPELEANAITDEEEVVEETPTAEAATETDPAAAKKAAAEAKKAEKAAAAAVKKAEREAKKAEAAAKKAAEGDKPKVERKFYANKVERISDKLGDKLGEYTILELADAVLEGDALAAKQQETLDAIKTSGKKVQNRITFLLEFIAGKSAKLNGVIVTALKVLNRDGKITVGMEGNYLKELIAHPYSENAAKAMGGNSILALKTLKVIVPGDKGEYVANPNSLVLMKLNSMGVGAAATE